MTGPSFRFRLERVRALRERREDMARVALAEAITQRTTSRDHLRTVEAHLEHARSEQRLVTGASATLSAAELLARQAFMEHIEAQRMAGAREVTPEEAQKVATSWNR